MQQTFLLPTSTQYPFDGVCSRIVRALQERTFAVKGVDVLFETYSNAQGLYTMVTSIAIPILDLELQFHRQQGFIDPNRYNTAAVSTLALPGKLLEVYEDYSGPTFYVYVGKDWHQEKKNFVHGFHVHSKMNHEPRTYLKYSGSTEPKFGGSYLHDLNPYLAFNDDLGRDYCPVGNEPTFYQTLAVMQEFDMYLQEKVLPFIRSAPDAPREEVQTMSIGSAWKGNATDQNCELIVAQMRELLTGHSYSFDDGWSSSSKRIATFQGISSVRNGRSRSVTVTDSYGVWGFHTGSKTLVAFQPKSMIIDHVAPSGNPLHWEITVID